MIAAHNTAVVHLVKVYLCTPHGKGILSWLEDWKKICKSRSRG